MTSARSDQVPDMVRGRIAAAAGSLFGALAASSCCLLPVVLFTLGAGGAWIGTLVRLAPLQPFFIAATVGCLGIGYWLVYRSRSGCADGETCRTSVADKFVKSVLALATVLVALALGFNFLAPMLSS
jgi:mercuric ion transport protein